MFCMKPTTGERVRKAENDFKVASQIVRFGEQRIYIIRSHARTLTDMAIISKAGSGHCGQRQLHQRVLILNSLQRSAGTKTRGGRKGTRGSSAFAQSE